jgi:4-alpha-glucanotransferase
MDTYRVNYEQVYDKQMILLRAAFARLSERVREDVIRFNPFWLDDYALFMAIKEQYDLSPWYDWPDEALRRRDSSAVERARWAHRSMMFFYRFVQWVFDIQWKELKCYANERGIRLIGDIPFYVSEDSAEAWSRREMFVTDGNGEFLAVAGAPPDYFNADGQNWGNPLYNWEYMEQENYAWWTERMRSALVRNDYVRLDHFRGFESFWRIPAGSESAKDGTWVKGPGIKPFEAMKITLGALPVIAEDLGDVGPEVEALLAETGFPGMGVLQFGFLGDDRHLPHRFDENKVAYTGTHDNTTLLAWMYEMRAEDRTRALFYCGFEGDWGRGGPNCGICRAWIRTLYFSKARMAIVPIQDLLGYGADTRTNIPGSPEGNWRFRITWEALDQIDTDYYKQLAAVTDRV